jgi:hypothetical protein
MTRRVVVTLTMLALLLMSQGTASAAQPISQERLAEAIRFRSDLGFDARPTTVSTMLATP